MNQDHSLTFEVVPKHCILDSFVDYEGYSISSKGFLLTAVDIIAILIKFTHSKPFYFTDSWDVDLHSFHLQLGDVHFALIRGPKIPMQYCSSQHQSLLSPPDTSTTECCFALAQPFFLSFFFFHLIALCSSPLAHWTLSDLGGSFSGIMSFSLFILFMGF